MLKVDTACKECIFAIYEGDTQTSCQANRIEKFKRNGAEVVEAYDHDGKEFYVLKNIVCNAGRTPRWEPLDKSDLPPLTKMYNEIRPKYQWILIDHGVEEKEVLERFAEIKAQAFQPERVTVVRFPSAKLTEIRTMALLSKNFPKWTNQTLREDMSVDSAIDLVLMQYKHPFYVTSRATDNIPINFYDRMETEINKEVRVFGILNIGQIRVVPTSIHLSLQGGMFGKTLQEKLEKEWPDKIINLL